ncbi:MAG: DUF892 family protein [Burkholderia gladioli]
MAPTRTVDFLLSRTLSKLQGVEQQAARLFAMLSRAAADPALGAHCQARRDAALRRLALIEACLGQFAAQFAAAPQARKCLVMEGLTEEAAELIEAIRPGATLDAGIRLAVCRVTGWQDGMLDDACELAERAGRPGLQAALAALRESGAAPAAARDSRATRAPLAAGPIGMRQVLEAGSGDAIIALAPGAAASAEQEAAPAASFPVPGEGWERDWERDWERQPATRC